MKIVTLALALVAALPAVAAEVDVRFTAPERYRDAGNTPRERERTTMAVAEIFKTFGAALPTAQTLRVDVTDIDLAGQLKATSHGDVRVVRGGADWPRIDFKWSLESEGRVLRQGEESLAGPSPLGPPSPREDGVALPHERRLVERWFVQRLDAPQTH